MNYYFSQNSSKYFPNPIEDIVRIVDYRMLQGFVPWLLKVLYGTNYDEYEHLDLPIFFVTEDDLGQNIPRNNWIGVGGRSIHLHMRAHLPIPADFVLWENICKDSYLPETVSIPDAVAFNYKEEILNALEDVASKQDFNDPKFQWEDYPIERVDSFDWLGLYYGYPSTFRCIIIRIEAILNNPLLNGSSPFGIHNNAVGGASIVLHELGHAILDPCCPSNNSLAHLQFSIRTSPKIAKTIEYVMEEAMANLFAFRSTRSINLKRPQIEDIANFMKNQPFPYALGLRIGDATKTYRKSMDFLFQTYITKWYRAKTGKIPITNYANWIRMILRKRSFNDCDIRDQYQTLFS